MDRSQELQEFLGLLTTLLKKYNVGLEVSVKDLSVPITNAQEPIKPDEVKQPETSEK